MCDPVTLGVAAAGATVFQGYQAYQQGKFQEGVANYNARQAENEATKTRNVSVEQENEQRRRVAELTSLQMAQSAAAGADVGSGSALQIREDTELLGEVDALRIRSNFEDQAKSLEDQATLTRQQGRNARRAGRTAFATSVATAPLAYLQVQSAFGNTVNPSWYNSNSSLFSGAGNSSINTTTSPRTLIG